METSYLLNWNSSLDVHVYMCTLRIRIRSNSDNYNSDHLFGTTLIHIPESKFLSIHIPESKFLCIKMHESKFLCRPIHIGLTESKYSYVFSCLYNVIVNFQFQKRCVVRGFFRAAKWRLIRLSEKLQLIHPSIHPPIHPSVRPSVHPSIHGQCPFSSSLEIIISSFNVQTDGAQNDYMYIMNRWLLQLLQESNLNLTVHAAAITFCL